ncbi:hypothetical protein [Burkholderia pseudomultivorans]|nr:hypothetical protein [Burkholderia pseudomultivorans]
MYYEIGDVGRKWTLRAFEREVVAGVTRTSARDGVISLQVP